MEVSWSVARDGKAPGLAQDAGRDPTAKQDDCWSMSIVDVPAMAN